MPPYRKNTLILLLITAGLQAQTGDAQARWKAVTQRDVIAAFGDKSVASLKLRTGSPVRIVVADGTQVNPSAYQNLDQVARAWVSRYPEIYRTTPENLQLVVNQRVGKVTYLIYRQTYNSIPVYQSRVDFRFHADRILTVTGADVYPGIELETTPSVTAAEALLIGQLATEFNLQHLDRVLETPELFVYMVEEPEIKPYLAWRMGLFVHHDDPTRYRHAVGNYEIWIDAHTGTVISIFDRVEEAPITGRITGMVKDVPYGTPTERPLRDLEVQVAGVGNAYTDSLGYYSIEAGTDPRLVTVRFKGPYLDIDARNVTDAQVSATVIPGDTFNVHFNAVNSIPSERDTYYHGLFIHDWVTDQDQAFTGTDYSMPAAVNIGSEDPLWPCNAYWDGTGINMFSAGGGCSATGEMADVIYHEYQHGITQYTYAPMASPYSSGMGEGFSDYAAMSIRNTPCMGDAFYGTPGNCLRDGTNTRQWPAPECGGEVHCLGDISMGALWKMRANLITSLGDTAQAVAHADTLFRWSMFGRPYTLPDLLLELLIADDDDGSLFNGTPYFSEITGAFAQHNVSSPIPEYGIDHTPVSDIAGTQDDVLITALIGSFHGDIVTAELTYIVNEFEHTMDMTDAGDGNFSAVIPAQGPGSVVMYYIYAADAAGNEMFSPDSAPAITHFYLTGSLDDFPVLYAYDVETPSGWRLGMAGDDATTGQWEQVDPIGTFAGGLPVQPEDDHTPDGTLCFVTGNAPFNGSNAGENDVDGGRTTLVSSALSLAEAQIPVLSYWRWYSNNTGDNPGSDPWIVQLSSDSIHWVDLENTLASSVEWTYHQFLPFQYVLPADRIWIRFVAQDQGGGSLVEAAVDDVRILNGLNIDVLIGDVNFDGAFNVIDVLVSVDIILGFVVPTGAQRLAADLNGDGVINVIDVIALVRVVLHLDT